MSYNDILRQLEQVTKKKDGWHKMVVLMETNYQQYLIDCDTI